MAINKTKFIGHGGVRCSCCTDRKKGNKKDRGLSRRVRAAAKVAWKKALRKGE